MKNFYEFVNLISEAPAPPPSSSPPAGSSPPTPPDAGGLSPSPSLFPPTGMGGIGGMGSGPSLGGMGGGSPSPDLGGGAMGGGSGPIGPVKPTSIKTIDVWTALQKVIDSKNGQSKQKQL